MAGSMQLQPVIEHGWRCGFSNLLRLENQRWWTTSRWWVVSVVMLVVVNGFLAFGIWIDPLFQPGELPPEFSAGAFDVFLFWMSIISVLTAIFIAQGAMIGEKQSGVAAWVLSAPVSRGAFVSTKFIGNAIGLLSTTVVLQGFVAYAQLLLREGHLLPILPILAALTLQSFYVLFYLALAIMLGTFFASRVPVLALSFGILLGQPFIDNSLTGFAPWLAWALPSKLPELARFAHRGESLPSTLSIFVTITFITGFLLLAIWRFKREEF
jgi:ABC-2 type transport system permease protein